MLNYNDTNIISGYIKQLLYSFNLPTIDVINKNMYLKKDKIYIYNNYIVKMLNDVNTSITDVSSNDYTIIQNYKFNKNIIISKDAVHNSNILNLTKNLVLSNNYYDTYTHKYLGDYLRFFRDYKNINLMSMYNCFSNEFVNKSTANTNISNIYNYFSNLSSYKIYKIPVKFFQQYTIALDCSSPIEIVCCFYDTVLNESTESEKLFNLTYQKINSSQFNNPILYTKLMLDSSTSDLASILHEMNTNEYDTLCMFIKLPYTNKSSISILEGNYCNDNDCSILPEGNYFNTSIINYAKVNTNSVDFKLITQHQLLSINSGISYPFADRLIEYLTKNTIDSRTTINDNIKRMQVSIFNKYSNTKSKDNYSYASNYGIWQDKYRLWLYSLASKENLLNHKQDILGYVDKDIEHKLGDVDIYNTPVSSVNISETAVKYRK
jgi:hypothetical protein